MSKLVAVSIGSDAIKVVKASLNKGIPEITSTQSLPANSLDEFILSERSDSFIVAADLEELHQDVLFLPLVDTKLLPSLVANEILKNHPGMTDFSSFYRIIGETFYEGKQFNKIACFIYANDALNEIVDRFSRHGKTITALYSTPYALSRVIQHSADSGDTACLCISDSGSAKCLFVLENNELYFVRHIQSQGPGFSSLDSQNINMTVDYCFQSLRIKPSRALVCSGSGPDSEMPQKVMIPVAPLTPPAELAVSAEIAGEYAAPLGALFCAATMAEGNLLPLAYRTICRQKRILGNGITLMIILCCLAIVAIAFEAFSINSLTTQLQQLRRDQKGIAEIRSAYQQATDTLQKATPLITAVNNAAAGPDMQQALITLTALRQPGVKLTSVTLTVDQSATLLAQTKGTIEASTYRAMQDIYEKLLQTCRTTRGMELTATRLEPKSHDFVLETQFRR